MPRLVTQFEFQDAKARYPENNFRLDYASLEQENANGGQMQIQDKIEEYADEIFTKLDEGAHIYFSGSKEMMHGILDMLMEVCTTKGIIFNQWIKRLKQDGRFNVEVY